MKNRLDIKLGIYTFVLTLALLISLPKIPVVISNKMAFLNSSVGGYALNIGKGGAIKDWREFKTIYTDTGGTQLNLGMGGVQLDNNNYSLLLNQIENRFQLFGLSNYKVESVENNASVILKTSGDQTVIDSMALLVQPGTAVFKELDPDFVSFHKLIFYKGCTIGNAEDQNHKEIDRFIAKAMLEYYLRPIYLFKLNLYTIYCGLRLMWGRIRSLQ